MQDSKKSLISYEGELMPYTVEEYRFQVNDIVDITINTTSPELNEILKGNESKTQLRNLEGLNTGDVFFLNGYTIDNEGEVDLPLVGKIKIVGMNTEEAKLTLEEKMKNYINQDNSYVRVRLGGIRYAALGEFNQPGKYTILQNSVTIFEAIANAGDMTILAKRSDILLVRQYPNGTKTYSVNLLSDEIKKSEFFFLRPNDLIYAQPIKKKSWGTGITFAETLTLLLALTTVALLYVNVTK